MTVLSLVKDDKPTGYLSNVHFAQVEYGEKRTRVDLFIKAAHDEKFKVCYLKSLLNNRYSLIVDPPLFVVRQILSVTMGWICWS